MEQLPTTESYVERRKLFKDVWEASKNTSENNSNILRKPKLIRTCRSFEESGRLPSPNKLRTKKLRMVCRKLLHGREFQAGNNLNRAHNRRRKYKIGNPNIIRRKKCKFSRTNRIIKKSRAPPKRLLPHELINLKLETTWSESRFNRESESSEISRSQLLSQNNNKRNKIKLLEDNQRSNKKFCSSNQGKGLKPFVKAIEKNLSKIDKELVKMHVINI